MAQGLIGAVENLEPSALAVSELSPALGRGITDATGREREPAAKLWMAEKPRDRVQNSWRSRIRKPRPVDEHRPSPEPSDEQRQPSEHAVEGRAAGTPDQKHRGQLSR